LLNLKRTNAYFGEVKMVKSKFFATAILTSILILAIMNLGSIVVNAQGQENVTILDAIGGTTDPAAGNYQYADGSTQTFTATPDSSYIFAGWTILSSGGSSISTDNPLSLPIVSGNSYSIQPNFDPLLLPPGATSLPTSMATAAIVVVLTSAGGTVSPTPGTYALDNATSLNLSATASSGWTFSHWVISGPITGHGGAPVNLTPTDNPYNVNHGYGATYQYQAVFTPTSSGSPGPSPTVPEFSAIYIGIVAVALLAIALGTFAVKRRK
jgi:hypothetical protein